MALAAGQRGRSAAALHLSDGMFARLLTQALAGSHPVYAFAITSVSATAINARRGLTLWGRTVPALLASSS